MFGLVGLMPVLGRPIQQANRPKVVRNETSQSGLYDVEQKLKTLLRLMLIDRAKLPKHARIDNSKCEARGQPIPNHPTK